MKMNKTISTLKNDHDPEPMHNVLSKIIHPLSATPPGQPGKIAIVPAYLDAVPNRVQAKVTFLEIIKPDE